VAIFRVEQTNLGVSVLHIIKVVFRVPVLSNEVIHVNLLVLDRRLVNVEPITVGHQGVHLMLVLVDKSVNFFLAESKCFNL